MNKLLTTLVLSLLLTCPVWAQVDSTRSAKEDTIQRPLLSRLRKENADKYQEIKEIQRTQPRSVQVTRYRFKECTPCDTRYVAELLSKEDNLTKSEVRNLMCTYRLECRDNAEFMPMFNELVHKVIQRNPKGFFDQYEAPEQSQYREQLDQVIMNPVRDDVEPQRVLQAVRSRLQETRSKNRTRSANIYSANLLEQLQTKIEANIEQRRLDRIRRLQSQQEEKE